jgi:uridylate kinase
VGYDEVLAKHLKVMDATAISMAREHNMSIVVFSLQERGNIQKAIFGETVGTVVEGSGHAE